MNERAAKKLLIVGWDAADWKVIDPLLSRGAMPTLARLIKSGARADLATLEPKLSPILWTSIATGKTADRHGILNFVEPDPASTEGAVRIASSTTRKTKALWNILTQSGLRTNVVSWYASHPAEPIAGVCVSNLFQEGMPPGASAPWPIPAGAVHPPEFAGVIAQSRVHPAALEPSRLLSLAPALGKTRRDVRVPVLAKAVAQCRSVHNAACAVLRSGEPWDCTMVFYDAIDVIGHHFMQYHPPRMGHVSKQDFDVFKGVMEGVYRMHDGLLGELLDLAGPGVTTMLLSDHGFHSDRSRPAPETGAREDHAVMDAAWHRSLGVLVLSGPGIKKGAKPQAPTLLDIAPTALNLLGLPAGADMAGRPLREAFDPQVEIEPVPGWDAVDGPAGLHPADLRQDPFEAGDAMKQLIDLGYLAPLPTGETNRLDLVERETRYNLAVVLMTTGRPDEAAAIFEELHRAHPAHPRYLRSFARCCFERGCYAEARAALTGYLQHSPDDTDAGLSLAAVHFGEHQIPEAAAVLEALDPKIPKSDVEGRASLDQQLGLAYILMRRPADASRIFSRALTNDPQSAVARHGMALVALLRRRYEDAVEQCLAVLAAAPVFADAHYTLGTALAWMGDHGHAIQSFKCALSLQPGLIDAHRFLAAVYRERKDAAGAEEHQRIAADLIESKTKGRPEAARLVQEPPMGPAEWSARGVVGRAGA